jgi:DNA-binding NarL/FixJ family response regulator
MKNHKNGGKPVRVLIVDDHLVVRVGLRALLEVTAQIVVAGETGSGREALSLVASERPDVVLLDLRLPDIGGIEVCRRIKDETPSPAVLFLTSYADDRTILAAMEAGADGYLLKDATGPDLAPLILTAAAGGSVLDPMISRRALEASPKQITNSGTNGTPAARLSPQEQRVLELAAEGKSNKQIAAAMGLSEGTVRNYLSAVFSKLGVASRVGAVTHWLGQRGG